MFPYWLLFSAFAAGSIEYRRRGAVGSQSAPLLALAGLFTALMIGLRYEVGGDWISYEEIFLYSRYADLGQILLASDPGYGALNWIGQQLSLIHI